MSNIYQSHHNLFINTHVSTATIQIFTISQMPYLPPELSGNIIAHHQIKLKQKQVNILFICPLAYASCKFALKTITAKFTNVKCTAADVSIKLMCPYTVLASTQIDMSIRIYLGLSLGQDVSMCSGMCTLVCPLTPQSDMTSQASGQRHLTKAALFVQQHNYSISQK